MLAEAKAKVDWKTKVMSAPPFVHVGTVAFVKSEDGAGSSEALVAQIQQTARELGANLAATRSITKRSKRAGAIVITRVEVELYRVEPCP